MTRIFMRFLRVNAVAAQGTAAQARFAMWAGRGGRLGEGPFGRMGVARRSGGVEKVGRMAREDGAAGGIGIGCLDCGEPGLGDLRADGGARLAGVAGVETDMVLAAQIRAAVAAAGERDRDGDRVGDFLDAVTPVLPSGADAVGQLGRRAGREPGGDGGEYPAAAVLRDQRSQRRRNGRAIHPRCDPYVTNPDFVSSPWCRCGSLSSGVSRDPERLIHLHVAYGGRSGFLQLR